LSTKKPLVGALVGLPILAAIAWLVVPTPDTGGMPEGGKFTLSTHPGTQQGEVVYQDEGMTVRKVRVPVEVLSPTSIEAVTEEQMNAVGGQVSPEVKKRLGRTRELIQETPDAVIEQLMERDVLPPDVGAALGERTREFQARVFEVQDAVVGGKVSLKDAEAEVERLENEYLNEVHREYGPNVSGPLAERMAPIRKQRQASQAAWEGTPVEEIFGE